MVKQINSIHAGDTRKFVKKTDYDTKIGESEMKFTDHDHSNKFITTQEFNKLTAENFDARLKQANLATKPDIDDFVEIIKFS